MLGSRLPVMQRHPPRRSNARRMDDQRAERPGHEAAGVGPLPHPGRVRSTTGQAFMRTSSVPVVTTSVPANTRTVMVCVPVTDFGVFRSNVNVSFNGL